MKKKDLPFWGIDFTPLRALVQNQNKQREQNIMVGSAGGVKSILEAAGSLYHDLIRIFCNTKFIFAG